MRELLTNWWFWSVAAGCILLSLAGALRLRQAWASSARPQGRHAHTGVIVSSELPKQSRSERTILEKTSVSGFSSTLPETLDELNQKSGLTAWRTKHREIAKRQRELALIESEIQAAKKRIEYIRTIAEQSSVVDEEKLRIKKLHQEMRRLEQEEARGDLEDRVERKRLEKDLAELDRDIRNLSKDPEVPRPKTEAEKRHEALQREEEKHAHEIAMQTLKAKQGLAARQALLEAMNQEVAKIQQNKTLTPEQREKLTEDTEDYYQDMIARMG